MQKFVFVRDPSTHHLVPVDLVFPISGGAVDGDPRRGFQVPQYAFSHIKWQKSLLFAISGQAARRHKDGVSLS